MRQKIRRLVALVSLLAFPITLYYFSPVVVLAGLAQGIAAGSLLLFGLLVVGSTLTGRLFCSWNCPAGAVQDLAASVRGRRFLGGRWIKYLIWTPWAVFGFILAVQAGGIHSIDPLYQTASGISVSDPAVYVVYYGVVSVFLLLALVLGRRGGYHTICWMAPFMIAGRAFRNLLHLPAFQLSADKSSCTRCRRCVQICPMSLDVQQMVERGRMEHPDCILCAQCADGCPASVIRFGFGVPAEKFPAERFPSQKRMNCSTRSRIVSKTAAER